MIFIKLIQPVPPPVVICPLSMIVVSKVTGNSVHVLTKKKLSDTFIWPLKCHSIHLVPK